jgi:hypothetical protein
MLIGLQPWEWPGDLRWLTLTILVAAATLTQVVALNFRTMPRAMAAALILIDVVALTIAGLLPLGVPVPESWGMLVGAANILGGFFGALALLKLSQA